MQISVITGPNKARTFSSFQNADLYCRSLLGRYSNLEYRIQAGNFSRAGSIDLEPVSFHSRHKSRILSGHLATFSQNVLCAIAAKKWPFNNMEEKDKTENQDHFVELICLLPSLQKF